MKKRVCLIIMMAVALANFVNAYWSCGFVSKYNTKSFIPNPYIAISYIKRSFSLRGFITCG